MLSKSVSDRSRRQGASGGEEVLALAVLDTGLGWVELLAVVVHFQATRCQRERYFKAEKPRVTRPNGRLVRLEAGKFPQKEGNGPLGRLAEE